MKETERDTKVAELRVQKAVLESVVADLKAVNIDAELGPNPSPSAVASLADKIASIKARGESARGGGKLSRSETVTVRLDPKLRYLAELAARLQRRTLSSYIEWAIERSLDNNLLGADQHSPSIKDESEHLWDVDEADRFAKLALRYPHLLTHEEQVRWKLIRETFGLWLNAFPGQPNSELNFEMLRRNWGLINDAAAEGRTGTDLDLDLI